MEAAKPLDVYRRLLARFGPQGWWPVTPSRGGKPRYRPGLRGRPSSREAVEICVGAILTQNAAWTNAERAVSALNAAGALDLEGLRRLPRRSMERLIRPSGYFVQKTLKLREFARFASDRLPFASWLARSPLSEAREALLAVKGVGPETADSMLLYAGARRVFVVDAYTKRIGSRLGWYRESADYARVQGWLTARLPRSVPVYSECHALLVALAKQHCRKKPACEGCPLLRACRHGRRTMRRRR